MSEPQQLLCPYCGNTAKLRKFAYKSGKKKETKCAVCCASCGARGPLLPASLNEEFLATTAWQSVSHALQWTEQPPQKEGWYWYRLFGKLNMWYVWKKNTRLVFNYVGSRATRNFVGLTFLGEWAGPIPMPKEKCDV